MSNSIADRLWPSWAPRPPEPAWGTQAWLDAELRNELEKYGEVYLGGSLKLTRAKPAEPTAEQSSGRKIWPTWR